MEQMYELWDWDTAHIINTYAQLSDAVAVVAATLQAYGPKAVGTWVLLRAMPDMKETVASDEALVALAEDFLRQRDGDVQVQRQQGDERGILPVPHG